MTLFVTLKAASNRLSSSIGYEATIIEKPFSCYNYKKFLCNQIL